MSEFKRRAYHITKYLEPFKWRGHAQDKANYAAHIDTAIQQALCDLESLNGLTPPWSMRAMNVQFHAASGCSFLTVTAALELLDEEERWRKG